MFLFIIANKKLKFLKRKSFQWGYATTIQTKYKAFKNETSGINSCDEKPDNFMQRNAN